MPPLISCVMVTGKTPAHLELAHKAAASFFEQDYPHRELVVVNDNPQRWLHGESSLVREIHCPDGPKRTLGELRNLGLAASRGEFIAQWDDDDFYHRNRLSYMMKHAQPQHVTLLLWQIRYSFTTGNAFALRYDRPEEGIPGTALYPAGPWRYPSEGKHEDSHFLNEHFGPRRIILDNHVKQFPGPAQYLRFFHGSELNTWDERHIMRRYASQATPLRNTAFHMAPQHCDYLGRVLSTYYHAANRPQLEGSHHGQ